MKKEKRSDAITTLIGSDTSIEGTIEFQNTIRLDGNIKGKIFSNQGTVIVGEKAVINAEITVDVAIIKGQAIGTIVARNKIEAYPPACIEGEIQAPVIVIEAGVLFNGNCVMQARTISSKKITDFPKKLAVNEGSEKEK